MATDPLRVALLSYRGNMFCGGQGVYVHHLARALVRRGHDLTIVSGPPYPDPPDGARLVKLPDHNFINRPAAWRPPDPLELLQPLHLAEFVLARAGANPEMLAASLRAFAYLRARMATAPLDVVHDNQGLGYGLLLIRALGVPVVATIHHPLQVDRAEDVLQIDGLVAKARRALYYPILMQRLVAHRLDGLITVSRFSRELVAKTYGLDPARIAVTENGVDPAWLEPPSHPVPREPGRLLFVGSTEDRKKGIVYLFEALAELPPGFRLIVVDGRRYPGRVYAQNAAERLRLGPRVEFKDKIPAAELRLEYARAELMVVPSLFEGFGLPALEAMASGTPLVCSTAGALPEVADDRCARFIPPRSARAIREAVLELSGDGPRLARMAAAGRERAARLFSWDDCARKVEEQYRLALDQFGRGRAGEAS